MLKPELAKKELEKFYDPGWKEKLNKAIGRLPGKLKEIARKIAFTDKQNVFTSVFALQANEDINKVYEKLDKLNPKERLMIFNAIFPKLAENIEEMWQFTKRLPYQMSYQRRAFRAPGEPQLTLHKRTGILFNLVTGLKGYDQDICWLAQWISYIPNFMYQLYEMGPLFAAVIDRGGKEGEEVFRILSEAAKGDHEIGAMGKHVTSSLLMASNPDGWELMEKMLLAAQRQEGLRQSILEVIDEAHPEAFKRMLRVIADNNLVRFSSIVRGVDIWFGFGYEAKDAKKVNAVLEKLILFIDDPDEVEKTLKKGSGKDVYIALWTLGFYNAVDSVKMASKILKDKDPKRRFAAAYYLHTLELSTAETEMVKALEDPDLRISFLPLRVYMQEIYGGKSNRPKNLFEILEKILPNYPDKEVELKPLLWDWMQNRVSKDQVLAAMISNLGKRSPGRLLPYLPIMGAGNRYRVAALLADVKIMDDKIRETYFTLAGDSSSGVRELAFKKLEKMKVKEDEALILEDYLRRKAADLRRGVIRILLNREDEKALAGAQRLLLQKNANQRSAGLEILREMTEKERLPEECKAIAKDYNKEQSKLTESEKNNLDAILKSEGKKPEIVSLENALGLLHPEERTKPVLPEERKINLNYNAAIKILEALDDLFEKNRNEVVEVENWDGSIRKELLGNLTWEFPVPKFELSLEKDIKRLYLKDKWLDFWNNRPASMRNKDGFELLRAMALLSKSPLKYLDYNSQWQKDVLKKLFPGVKDREYRYQNQISNLLTWFLKIDPPKDGADFVLDVIETAFSMIPKSEIIPERIKTDSRYPFRINYLSNNDWRISYTVIIGYFSILGTHRSCCPYQWSKEQVIRCWKLMRWMDEPVVGKGDFVDGMVKLLSKGSNEEKPERFRPSLELVLAAYEAGGATDADIYDQLLGPHQTNFGEIRMLSSRKESKAFVKIPRLKPIFEKCRKRILEVELVRGDLPTPASGPAMSLRYAGGMEVFIDFLKTLGKGKFIRWWTYDNESKSCTFSHIIRATLPGKDDTVDVFKEKIKESGLKPARLMEAGVFAPQWSRFIEKSINWNGYSSGVWWIHAHTKDTGWTVDQEIREAWNAEVNSFTPLSGSDLLNGAVDVQWFREVYSLLGEKKWDKLQKAAKYASGGKGHTRAQLFAKAMTGKVTGKELTDKINDKRNQDSVRALGLLPLEKGNKRESDLLNRYELLQEFLRTGKKFGSQRQASEKLAVKIGMENLARTAGYKDPIRLEWAMEFKSVEDLAKGSVVLNLDNIEIILTIDELGEPNLVVNKNSKKLKSIPAKLKKNPQVKGIKERAKKLKQQSSRMRKSLEEAMCRGDVFTGEEIADFMKHPVLSPMIRELIFVDDEAMGFPDDNGTVLRDHSGNKFKISKKAPIRIAHTCDLLKSGEWSQWQKECFQSKRKQPFKQVFRELYLNVESESEDGKISNRYSGHQLNPRQATAILGKRGWVSHPQEGTRKTFHDEQISVHVDFGTYFLTPADVEDLAIEGVHFTKAGEWEPIKLDSIPPRLFSEVMRDMDLVVSVAHTGGIDLEASQSTVEMRSALIRETVSMLDMENVRIKDNWALIEGELSNYSVHLGSAVVHRMPGGHVCIVPVHSQHRGRIFLPFIDDDPKTAEVVSKVLMLANDKKIKDPTILEQILV